jgi:hypothetical protein
MQAMDPIGNREADITRIAESKEEIALLRRHLKDIIEGPAFKGSHRSGQFLKYIVDQSIAGHFDSLKERLIGVELFGRSPSYDTGEDAIVRVTASDVRKRLLQHYGRNGIHSEFRVSLPLGSYIPEITREPEQSADLTGSTEANHKSSATPRLSSPIQSTPVALTEVSIPASSAVPSQKVVRLTGFRMSHLLFFGILLFALNAALWGILWNRPVHSEAATVPGLPWSTLFGPSHSTHLITSDPNIVVVQEITGGQLSVSDYANHKYIPEPNKLQPEEIRFCHTILWGDNSAAAIDSPIAAGIAEFVRPSSGKMDVRAARSIQLTDLKTDDNFIFLGSPRSDPWSALFRDELDFAFAFDKTTKQEVIINAHPHQHESLTYVPTALGWATGQSFAIIALIQNPDQNGQVLLLAGANGEGTEAAGKLVTDPSRLTPILKNCGVDPLGPLRHFELLIRLNTMAGSPNNIDVVACHILPGYGAQHS